MRYVLSVMFLVLTSFQLQAAPVVGMQTGNYQTCLYTEHHLQCFGYNSSGQAPGVIEADQVQQVALTTERTCFLDRQGVWCMGGSAEMTPIPGELLNPTALVSGNNHHCAISEGRVYCWGYNYDGQLNVTEDLTNVKELVAQGESSTCALDDYGVHCWGGCRNGTCNPPSALKNPRGLSLAANHGCLIDDQGVKCWGTRGSRTTVPFGIINPRKLYVGNNHTCVLHDLGVRCWGENTSEQTDVPTSLTLPVLDMALSDGASCALTKEGVTCWGDPNQTKVPAGLKNISQLRGIGGHFCALGEQGAACWGNDNYGETRVPTTVKTKEILGLGGEHTCVTTEGDKIACWGRNAGEYSPLEITPSQLAYFDQSNYASCYILDGKVVCKGSDNGQISQLPMDLKNPTKVSISDTHACAIDETGVRCWGNGVGGDIPMPTLTGPKEIASGNNFTCAIDAVGVHCWGNSSVFNGSSMSPPTDLVAPEQLQVGYSFACVVDQGKIRCWGANDNDQISVPTDLTQVTRLSINGSYGCAIDSGNVRCWGNNFAGQTQAPGDIVNARSIVTGESHACALGDNGLKCWGSNAGGQATVPISLSDF